MADIDTLQFRRTTLDQHHLSPSPEGIAYRWMSAGSRLSIESFRSLGPTRRAAPWHETASAYCNAVLRHIPAHLSHFIAAFYLDRIRKWQRACLEPGRSNLGLGYSLAIKP